ncbi:MAG: hypothetical protein ACRDY3_05515 [Acidimicrobiales bacterium]
MPVSPEDLRRRAESLQWFHSIDLGQGVVTQGLSEIVLPDGALPDFRGRSVLDVGAWDGYYSYLAERRGARRVVALDHYAWGVDIPARDTYWRECARTGHLPDHRRDVTDFWRPDLPGKRGFDFAHEVFDSKVESVVADFTELDPGQLGVFDIVIYCGVLYHMKEPLTCLERVRAVTGEVAVIETEALHLQHMEASPLCQFRAADEVGGDFGNWWVPTLPALEALVRSAGFGSATTVVGPPLPGSADPNGHGGGGRPGIVERVGRRVVHALVENPGPAPAPSAPSQHYRAVLHARP